MSRKKKDVVIRQLVRAYLTIPDAIDLVMCVIRDDRMHDTAAVNAHMESHEARKNLAFAVGTLLDVKPGPGVTVVVDRKTYRVKIAEVTKDIKGTRQVVVIEPE